jgi:hypothetical protein
MTLILTLYWFCLARYWCKMQVSIKQMYERPSGIYNFNSVNSRFQHTEFMNSCIHDFNFMNLRFQLHGFTILTSRIHDFNFFNSRIQLHQINFTNSLHESEILNLWSWNVPNSLSYKYNNVAALILSIETLINLSLNWSHFGSRPSCL